MGKLSIVVPIYKNQDDIIPFYNDFMLNINPHIDDYQEIMDLPFDSQKYLRLVNSDDTYFYKLSWRMNFKETNDDGKQTFYGHFMNEL